jgi:hypothetical protein
MMPNYCDADFVRKQTKQEMIWKPAQINAAKTKSNQMRAARIFRSRIDEGGQFLPKLVT